MTSGARRYASRLATGADHNGGAPAIKWNSPWRAGVSRLAAFWAVFGLPCGLLAADSPGVLIRRETAGDIAAVRAVTAAAFARPGQPGQTPSEATLVDELRTGPAWLPALSLIAADPSGTVIGHVLATRGHVESAPALGLAPLSVHPDHQGHGVGSALVHAVLGAADAMDEPLVAVLGDPAYYQRFGFRPSADYDIAPPVDRWTPHFQVCTLAGYDRTVRGTFTYPDPFHRL